MKHTSARKGFTLIELLIVITIIGILAAALLPSILGAPARARDAARKAHMNSIVAALETYNNDEYDYPSPGAEGCLGDGTFVDLDGYFQGGNPPTDPQGDNAVALGACAAGEYYYCQFSGNPINYIVASYVELAPPNATDAQGYAQVGDLVYACDGTETDADLDWTAPAAGTDNIYFIVK